MKNKNKIAVYTAIFGNYDKLREPIHKDELLEQADFFCFTDNEKIKSDFYQIIHVSSRYENNILDARYYKIMSHLVLKKYEFTIWLDGAFRITTKNVSELVERYLAEGEYIATFEHPYRQCVYDEVLACIRLNKENLFDLFYQAFKYYIRGMPANFGMIESSVLIRRNHSAKVIQMNKMWWQELHTFTSRDQISFPYIWWKLKLNLSFIPGNNKENPYFLRFPHYSKSSSKNHNKALQKRYLNPMYWIRYILKVIIVFFKKRRTVN